MRIMEDKMWESWQRCYYLRDMGQLQREKQQRNGQESIGRR